jgi:hypothetical protein
MKQIAKEPTNSNIVISDTRYLNEIGVIRDFARMNNHTLHVWRINRLTSSPVDDISEHILDTYKADAFLQNQGDSLEKLHALVEDELPHTKNANDVLKWNM